MKDVVLEVIERGKLVLFSSHQMNYIEEFCDSIAILHGGRVVLAGELREIKHSYPRNRLTVRSRDAERIRADLRLSGDIAVDTDESGALTVTLPSPELKGSVMARLTETYDIDGIYVTEPSLGDIFVEYAS